MQKKMFSINDPLSGYKEEMFVDEESGKRLHTYSQNVDYILKAAHEFRMKEPMEGQRYHNLIQHGKFKMLGIIPQVAFFSPKWMLYKRPTAACKEFLEEFKEFKTTNAKLGAPTKKLIFT